MYELRDLPGVDALMKDDSLEVALSRFGPAAVKQAIRNIQKEIRDSKRVPEWSINPSGYLSPIFQALDSQTYRTIFNLTGTIIHSNLGRALIDPSIIEEITPLLSRPINLEYNLDTGSRGQRDAFVEAQLSRLTGCEAAAIVNNNAAALMLVLNTFALGKFVPVSRGELVEIGGSFRLPELMTKSGSNLIEVGTTNKTHIEDFESVLEESAMLLKVHPSNYHISGFSEEVEAKELAKLANSQGIPSCVDLGSGALIDLSKWSLPSEPTPQSVLSQGIDLVTFSGDKLLGAVQSGLIVGKKTLIDQIKKNPLKRALRADKLTLTILSKVLRLYEDPETLDQKLPLLKILTTPVTELENRAETLKSAFSENFSLETRMSTVQIGSGALPDKTVESLALVVKHNQMKPEDLLSRMRSLSTPIIGRIKEDRVWLDLRGAEPLEELTRVIGELG
ncbi:MAG: L-seryl-tRNA(Sec) selenium transferase [Gammaproteobacteria bacterium]|nr:L-seryl-tRNA(Sec) selenium transferase [Gammaproteobacteria bacterium]